MCSLKITSSYYFLYVIINKVFRAPNTGQLASRKGSSRDAGHLPPNTGRPVKYGTSGKPSSEEETIALLTCVQTCTAKLAVE